MSLVSCLYSKGLISHGRWAALLETQLNFIRTCPCQAKDKIMLLIQKLEEKKAVLNKTTYLFISEITTPAQPDLKPLACGL